MRQKKEGIFQKIHEEFEEEPPPPPGRGQNPGGKPAGEGLSFA